MAAIATPRLQVDPTAYGNDDAWRNLKAPTSSLATTSKAITSQIPEDQRALLDFPDTFEGFGFGGNLGSARKASQQS